MKKLILLFAMASFAVMSAQTIDSNKSQKKLYVKANAVFLPIGMLNAGVEHQLSEKWTLQEEIFISPWKSFGGMPAQIYMGGIEARYYFGEAFKHFYVGANLHVASFHMRKFNYWGDGDYQYGPEYPVYKLSDVYQSGFAIMGGATVGYQWQINEKWNLDLFVGGGHSEGFYHGYVMSTGERYDVDYVDGPNRSGEWIPYKGGLMISYRLK
ncbi:MULTISPECIES: DUF3575 domain-containing protein [Chryseobacterium]|uniref:DUF3575 domain-containing protein n=1 Tax=Chryseobacterium sp. R2A-55 TaxID=2744445 RepID=UPI001F263A9B|nr:DUF3575 domain-containing protein [Chryseobacterium sp. R2A-55]